MTDAAPNGPAAVVIPTYGRREPVWKCLRSVAAMRPRPPVVLLVDGNEEPLELPADVAGIVEVVREPNQGAAHARNVGYRAAADRGADVVCFLDDDAIAPADWYERHVAAHAEMPGAAAVGGAVENLHPESPIARMTQEVVFRPLRNDPGPVRFIPTLNASFKVASLEQVGGFDEGFPGAAGEDVDLCWRIVAAGWTIHYEPGLTVLHDHPTSWRVMVRHQAGYARGFVGSRSRWPDLPGAEFLRLGWPRAVAGSVPHVVRETRRAVADGGMGILAPALLRETVFRVAALKARARLSRSG
ncbi:MAG TPA: glycosyltransferase [Acidimicrobiales bacterium]|jgi:GT2 family glycosyltransferase|nr:glycosyltransferase [Acidimicrobiales bacterium]